MVNFNRMFPQKVGCRKASTSHHKSTGQFLSELTTLNERLLNSDVTSANVSRYDDQDDFQMYTDDLVAYVSMLCTLDAAVTSFSAAGRTNVLVSSKSSSGLPDADDSQLFVVPRLRTQAEADEDKRTEKRDKRKGTWRPRSYLVITNSYRHELFYRALQLVHRHKRSLLDILRDGDNKIQESLVAQMQDEYIRVEECCKHVLNCTLRHVRYEKPDMSFVAAMEKALRTCRAYVLCLKGISCLMGANEDVGLYRHAVLLTALAVDITSESPSGSDADMECTYAHATTYSAWAHKIGIPFAARWVHEHYDTGIRAYDKHAPMGGAKHDSFTLLMLWAKELDRVSNHDGLGQLDICPGPDAQPCIQEHSSILHLCHNKCS